MSTDQDENAHADVKPIDSVKLRKRIAKAKTALVIEHPFFGTLAMNMPTIITEAVPTAATDGRRVLFNPNFMDQLTDEEVTFVVAHENAHPMLEHNFRRLGRNPKRWNMAGDYVINKLLVDEGIGKMPKGALHNDAIYNAGGGTTDGIYNILPEEGDDGGGGDSPSDNPLDGDLLDAPGNSTQNAQEAAEWKIKIAQAAQSAKMMGKLSANLERFVHEVLNPKVDWRDVLERFVEKCRTDQRSWARPNRRFISRGLYLPSISGEAMGELVFAIDCSGSVGADDLAQFAAEVCCVSEDHKPSKLHVVYFDSEVCHYDKFDRDEPVSIKPHGGGGTAFSPVFNYIEKNGIEPLACIFLTDLYCNDFGKQPGYPVLWVTYGADQAPFGEIVKM